MMLAGMIRASIETFHRHLLDPVAVEKMDNVGGGDDKTRVVWYVGDEDNAPQDIHHRTCKGHGGSHLDLDSPAGVPVV